VIALATLGVVFAVLVTLVQAHRLARFEVHSFDLAIFAQGLWSLAHGHTGSSIQETSFLAVHFSPLMFALAPLARLAGSATPLLLVFAQGLALGASAPLVYLIAQPAGRLAARTLGIVTLFQPALLALARDGFHDVTFGVPLCLLLALAIERAWSARAVIIIAAATALLADEVFPLVLPGAALWLLLEKRRREAALVAASGVLAFLLVNTLLLGWLRGGALHVESLYAHWKDPAEALKFLRSGAVGDTLTLAVLLLAPLAFLPLARPTRLLPAAIVFALCAASRRPAQRSIFEHYHAPVTPFVLAAAASALSRLQAKWPQGANKGAALTVLATIVVTAVFSPVRGAFVADFRDLRAGADDPRAALVAKIPAGASVLASVDFLHALSDRERLYGLPAALRGTKDWSTIPYELPDDLEYVIADTMDTASWPPGLERALAPRWEAIALDRGLGVLGISGSTVLLGKGGPPLVEPVREDASGLSSFWGPDAPVLTPLSEPDSLTWSAPRSGKLGVFVEQDVSFVRPLFWNLYLARPWPKDWLLRERSAPPKGELRLIRRPG
jgi:uncharacterized membrane protein